MKRFLMLLLALLLLGCRAAEDPINGYEPDESERLILYTSHKKEVYEPIVREFEERTGIWVTVVNGGTNELLDEIEAHPDDPICDVMFGGGVDINDFVGYFAVFDNAIWSFDEAIFIDASVSGEVQNETDVGAFWSFDGTDATVVSWVSITDIESGAFAG